MMQIYKSKWFGRWAEKEGLTDGILATAVQEMEKGLIDADLGGHVMKKRVGVAGQGKSGGLRTLMAFKKGDKAFFIFGFAKNQRGNIGKKELVALKLMASSLLGFTSGQLKDAVNVGELIEVKCDE